jgi:hypothetical protein
MPGHLVRTFVIAALSATLLGVVTIAARAGGGSFDTMDDTDDDSGPPFVGDVKDRSGNPIADAKVTVKGFDKSVDPEGVDFTCSADGYKFFARTKEPTGTGPKAPIAVTCLVEKG